MFLPADHAAFRRLEENDIELDGDELILRRVQFADGRSRAFINDQPVSVSLLREVGGLLAEIHGQHDDRAFLDREAHGVLLDAYGGLDGKAVDTARAWETWRRAETALSDHRKNVERAREERDYLEHALEELSVLDPQQGEEAQLASRRQIMMNAEKFVDDLKEADSALTGDGTLDARLNAALRKLERKNADAEGALDGVIRALDRVLSETADAKSMVAETLRAVDFDAGELERTEERLFALRAAARKHRVGVDDLSALVLRLRDQLDAIENDETKARALEAECVEARKRYSEQAETLSRERSKAAAALDREVTAELPPLKLEKAQFETRVDELDLEQGGPRGINRVEFTVATNPGSAAGPLMKVASGGELARFILALKVVLAARGSAPTLIFDEVDTAVGGAVADAIGGRLARLAGTLQVLAVTHSPQVAARSTGHVMVLKAPGTDATADHVLTQVRTLDEAQRLEEIARMLSGREVTQEARAAAERLIKGAA